MAVSDRAEAPGNSAPEPDPRWHTLSGSDTVVALALNAADGLTTAAAAARLAQHGPNELAGTDTA